MVIEEFFPSIVFFVLKGPGKSVGFEIQHFEFTELGIGQGDRFEILLGKAHGPYAS